MTEPPKQIKYAGETLELYDPEPMEHRGRQWYTYSIEGDSRLWEYCPATRQVVRTQE